MRQRVDVLQQRSRDLRHDAEAVYLRESADCRTAVLVNNCLGGAADRRLEKIEQARALEKEINVLGRGIRRFDLAERRAERARRQAERVRQTTVEVDGAAPKLIVPPDLSVVPAGLGKSD